MQLFAKVMLVCLIGLNALPVNASGPVEFQLGTAEGLLKACTFESESESETEYHFGSCAGFIRGVRMSFETIKIAQGSRFICPPDDIQNGQLRDAVVSEIRSGRNKLTDLSPLVIVDALTKAYPCQK